MTKRGTLGLVLLLGAVRVVTAAEDDVMMRAMVDELDRSMNQLVIEGLPKSYFIQLTAQDRTTYVLSAAYGGLQRTNQRRVRTIKSRIRVGSYRLDNTNFGRGAGRAGLLPLDDDYTALRQAIWLVLDEDYKRSVETLTAKLAYLKDKSATERPDDFAPVEPVVASEPLATLAFDAKEWESNLKRLSARFAKHSAIQDSDVSLFAGKADQWIVTSAGTRLRTGDSGVLIEISAEIQAGDGMYLSDSRRYVGETFEQIASIEQMLADVDQLCVKLIAQAEAEVLDHYTGPVLFEPIAAGIVVESLLGDKLCARPIPVGAGGWADNSLEKKIGLRILPRSFQVFDNPGTKRFAGKLLAGAYSYDDEARQPQRVKLVENGILKTLVSSRAPTDKITQSTGHGRSRGFGDPSATIGCLYLRDEQGVGADELKTELRQAAREEGLEFSLRIETLERGGAGSLGDPIYAYKVFVEDGREEPVRGIKFQPVSIRAFKRILAAGDSPEVYNSISRLPTSFIAPALLFEELDLVKIEDEFDKLPILKAPALR